ncbi:hypothetical protein ACPC54_41140 [Kitasatospora sp. NPDC094028]
MDAPRRKADNLTDARAAKLDALDEPWRLEPDWSRSYRRLLAYPAAVRRPSRARPKVHAPRPASRAAPTP